MPTCLWVHALRKKKEAVRKKVHDNYRREANHLV
jgi:hypothetical protein